MNARLKFTSLGTKCPRSLLGALDEEFTHLGKRQGSRLRQISRLLAPFPNFKQLGVPVTEIFERCHYIQHMLQDEKNANEWK